MPAIIYLGMSLMKNFRKYISVILTIVMIVSMFSMVDFSAFSVGTVWDGSVAEGFSSGTGTQEDPYIIKTAEELAYLSQQVNWGYEYEDCYFELGADIILNDTTNWENWGTYNDEEQLIAPVNTWTPIGMYNGCRFEGCFNGKGYTVSGIFINNISGEYFGLFGNTSDIYFVDKLTIKNVNVDKSYICGSNTYDVWNAYVGGVVGYGNAENCTFNGKIVGNFNDEEPTIGGIVGYGDAKNCVNNGQVECVTCNDFWCRVGGVVGYGNAENCVNNGSVKGGCVGGVVSSGNAINCSNTGTLYAYDSFGGVVNSGFARYCFNTGDIYGYSCGGGGVIGGAYSYSTEITQYCFNSGNITVDGVEYDSFIGGVAGSGVVQDCYNSGNININVTYDDTDNEIAIGGIIGRVNDGNGFEVSDCYNAGVITANGTTKIGAAFGENYSEGVIKDCYYLDTVFTTELYAKPLTDEQMKKSTSFVNYNFNRVWEYLDGAEYPYPTLRCFGSKEYCFSAKFYVDDVLVKEELIEENGTLTFKKADNRQGLLFYAWEKDGVLYYPDNTITMTEDISFNAVWQKNNVGANTWDGSVDTEWQGNGSEEDPYLITNGAELAGLSQSVNEGNKYYDVYFSLTTDIYLNDVSDAYGYYVVAENQWIPIGDYDNEFCGIFNGNNHTIKGLYIKTDDNKSHHYGNSIGLFGYIHGDIKNLNIDNSYLYIMLNGNTEVNRETINAGLLVGYTSGDISNCSVNGEVKSVITEYFTEGFDKDLSIGGVAGYSYGNTTDCVNNATVTLTTLMVDAGLIDLDGEIGGVVGVGKNITNCINYGTVSSFGFKTFYYHSEDLYLGGVSGRAENIEKSINYGKVFADKCYSSDYEDGGASVAGVSCVVNAYAVDCVNNGEVSGFENAGGIAAKNWNDTVVIEKCINNGDVTGGSVGGVFCTLHNGYSKAVECVNNGTLTVVATLNYDNGAGGIMYTGDSAVNCVNNGKIVVNGTCEDDTYVGGIFGYLSSQYHEEDKNAVFQCKNYGNIIINDFSSGFVGGIGGTTGNYNEIISCYNQGNISFGDIDTHNNYHIYIGGIAGEGQVINSYNTGKVNIKSATVLSEYNEEIYIGGALGYGSVENSYNIGTIKVDECNDEYNMINIGGLIGYAENEVIDSFYLNSCVTGVVSGNSLGKALSSAQLSSKSTFFGWDFNKTWEFNGVSGYSYPNLRFIGSKNFNYYLQFVDGDRVISKQLLKGGTSIDFSAPYENSEYQFAYWEKDGVYYYPEDEVLISEDSVYTAVWQSSNSDSNTWDGTVDTMWQGSGTETDPYLITSPEELAGLAKKVNESSKNSYEGCYFKQTADIYLNDINDYSNILLAENTWTPIGNGSYRFKGNYDGCGYKISGLYIKGNGNELKATFYGGLFGRAENATFKNINIDNSFISYTYTMSDQYYYEAYLSGIVCYGENVTFDNCHNNATLFAPDSYSYAGGLIAYAYYNISAINCSNNGNINGKRVGGIAAYVYGSNNYTETINFDQCVNNGKLIIGHYAGGYAGGITGQVNNYGNYIDITFTSCENYGEIVNEGTGSDCGGIAGIVNYYTYIEKCNNYGKIIGNNSVVGGIIGDGPSSSYTATVYECVNYADIYSESTSGGIAGYGYVYISGCENNGDIYGGSNVGGIIGQSQSSLYNNINNGNVTGNKNYIGGIVGDARSYISYCTNNGAVTGNDDYIGGIAGESDYSISSCVNNGAVTGNDYYVGGITGITFRSVSNCYNTAEITGRSYVGGIAGELDYSSYNISNSYNTGNIKATQSYAGGIAGYGKAESCYNSGNISAVRDNAGGIVGYGNANNCYNTAQIYGKSYVGGISGSGRVTSSYNIGDVTAINNNGGALIGDSYSSTSVVNSYYLDSVNVSVLSGSDVTVKGTAVDSTTLASNTLSGFDFETIWTIGQTENYIYPTLTGNVHEVTYKVTFLDADGVTVLKEQNVRKGYSAYPPTVEMKVDNDSVYALDHWDGEYKNITKDTTVKAVYKKTDIIKFLGNESEITVPFGYSKDNLLVDIESSFRRLLMVTTHEYKMKCDVVWDLSSYNPTASGEYVITGKLTITDSPYYAMLNGESVVIKVTVNEGDASVFDESQLDFTVDADDTVTITGYNGQAENIRIPSKLGGRTVSAIGDNAFINNTKLVTLYLPNTVKSIGKNAFKGNNALVQVTFSEGLLSVGEYAFADTALTNVTLPATLESIGIYAFGAYNGENIVNGFVIYAYADTDAVTYANDTGIACVSISTKTDTNTGITVTAEDTVMLAVSQVVGGDYFDTANDIVEGDSKVSLFEIKLVDDSSEETQPGNIMTISVPVPDGFTGENCKIYRINADGSYKDMQAELIDGRLVFNTAHLSYYAIVSDNSLNYIVGDLNGSGVVDASDLALLKLYLAGAMSEVTDAADCDKNGKIDASDLALLKLYLAGAIIEF